MAGEGVKYPIDQPRVAIKPPRLYPLLNISFTRPAVEYNGLLRELDLEEAVELAPTGAKIWFPMKFIGNTYKVYDKYGKLIDKTLTDFRLPVVHLASFSRSKLVEITNMGSGRGSVKEVDGHSDWEINISGIITPEDNQPQGYESFMDMIGALKAYDDAVSSIEVSSELLTALGIYRVLIMDVTLNQVQGTPEELAFTMRLMSDIEFELEVIA